ncbi:MAG: hypothetical protein FJ387_18855 [Verrucomicrobia bacterium]|nr:hypothetical protein [Verrucomicrobiota bacterium]
MTLRYDEDFLEAVLSLCATSRRAGVPSAQIARFQRAREKLYAILEPEARNAAFFQLELEWFREWGLERLLLRPLAEYPLVPARLDLLAFRRAQRKGDESAELYVNETAQHTGVVALRPDRFAQDSALLAFLRHEYGHLNDMVDPLFGYSPALHAPALTPMAVPLARERYRVLWDASIDGRLTQAGHPPPTTAPQHRAAFDRAFGFWSESKRAEVFDSLWHQPSPTHRHLAGLATDPRDLASAGQPVAGAACPLCGFPTFNWAPTGALSDAVLDRIRHEFPPWTIEAGACVRCVEVYQAQAISTAAPTPA